MNTYQVVMLDVTKRMAHHEDVPPIFETKSSSEASIIAKLYHEKYSVDVGVYCPNSEGYTDYYRVNPDPEPPPSPLAEFVVFWAAENRNPNRGWDTKEVHARMKDFDDREKAEKLIKELQWRAAQDEPYQSRYVSNITWNFS